MVTDFQILLKLSVFFAIFPLKSCFGSNQILVFPLKTQNLPYVSSTLKRHSSSVSSDKLMFQHNVTLTLSLSVGSPPQNVTMVLDTGSELPWLHCIKNSDSVFTPRASSSYSPIPCSSPLCKTLTRDLPIPASCPDPKIKNICHVAVSYADASSIEGDLAQDTFQIGSNTRPGSVFGCMDSGQSSNSEEDRKTTGLMGMNRGVLSFVTQTRVSKFSYCISGLDSSGILILGDAKSNLSWLKPLSYTPLVQQTSPLPYFDRAAYTVKLEGIRVGNNQLNLPKSVFEPDHTGAGQTIVDSGTQFTFLLGPVYTALKTEFLRQTKSVLKVLDEPNFVFQGAMDMCFRVGESGLPEVPAVSMVLGGGVEMRVAGRKLMYMVPGKKVGNDWVYCMTYGNSDLLGIEAFVIGHHHQQNLWMEYDVAGSRVGFAEVRCDLASQRLQTSLI